MATFDLTVTAVSAIGEILLADSACGESHAFRETIRLLGFDCAVGVHAPMKVWCLDPQERCEGVDPGPFTFPTS